MQAFVISSPSPSSSTTNNNNPLDNGTLITNHPLPHIPNEKYALIQILRAGICNTDLEILSGYMGFTGILGHEFVGKVVNLHPHVDSTLHAKWMGKRVCGDINIGCCNFSISSTEQKPSDYCQVCNDDNYYNSSPNMSRNHCPNRTVLGILNQHGTFAEYMILPIQNLHLVPEPPEEVCKDEIAVFAEPLAAAYRVVEQGLVQFSYTAAGGGDGSSRSDGGGDRVAILGDGKLGLCIAEILGRKYLEAVALSKKDETTTTTTTDSSSSNNSSRSSNSNVSPHPPILFGKHEHKLDLVSNSGVDRRFVTECYVNTVDIEGGVSSNHANQYDVVIDSTGNPNGLTLAMSLCRPMGRLVLKSTCAAGDKDLTPHQLLLMSLPSWVVDVDLLTRHWNCWQGIQVNVL
jgi:threonine dehydrogenase-like Zn-dependent dehydrogenase